MSNPQATEQENVPDLVEFRSRYFGQRPRALFVVRTFGIWITFVLFTALIVYSSLRQNRPLETNSIAALLGLLGTAVALQWLAQRASLHEDLQRVTWCESEGVFTLYHFRITRRFGSFGSLEPELKLKAADIESFKVVVGRGRHLRLHTTQGFVSISNDIASFPELCALVETHCPL